MTRPPHPQDILIVELRLSAEVLSLATRPPPVEPTAVGSAPERD